MQAPRYVNPGNELSSHGNPERPLPRAQPGPPPRDSQDLRAYTMSRPLDLAIEPDATGSTRGTRPHREMHPQPNPNPHSGRDSDATADLAPVRRPSRALWGGIGFVAGVAVWHFVGFWAFVSEVVFSGQPPRDKLTTMILAPAPPVPVVKAERPLAATRAVAPPPSAPSTAAAPAPAAQQSAPPPLQAAAVAPSTPRDSSAARPLPVPAPPAAWSTRVTTSSID